MRISDWSSDVCSSDLREEADAERAGRFAPPGERMPLDRGRRRRRRTRGADQHRGDRVGGIDHGARAPQESQPGEGIHQLDERSEESSGGKECGRTFIARWSRDNSKNKNKKIPK